MKTLEENFIIQVKDCFFNSIGGAPQVLNFETFVGETLDTFGRVFHVETVSLYLYQDWKQLFILTGTSGDHYSRFEHSTSIHAEELERFLANGGILRPPFIKQELNAYDRLAGLMDGQQLFGFIAIKDKADPMVNCLSDDDFGKIGNEYAAILIKFQNLMKHISGENKYKQLYRVTEKFHSTMNMDDLLGEIVLTLEDEYPTFTYYLLLSQDHQNQSELPIRDLEYDSENITAMHAYVTGTVQFERSERLNRSVLYAPLKGKQGVYGVLQVIAPDTFSFPKDEVEFISLLANTAGSALENVRLYQQSRKLISDLRLINETSHYLNSNMHLTETIQYLTNQILHYFKAQEVGFILFSQEKELEEVKVLLDSTRFFFKKQARVYIDYLKEKIFREFEALFIGDFSIPGAQHIIRHRSIMAVPMDISEHLKGIAIVMHQEPYFFLFEQFRLLQALIHHSTLVFTNVMLREELEKMIITDHLTKLNSRVFLDETIERSMTEDEQGTLILIDIDDFKKINDTYGHQVGDEVLIQVANLIKSNIRENDVGARWGGEELALYLPNVNLEAGVAIAERLVDKVAEQSNPHVTVSCGVSYWNKKKADSYMYLFKRADEALYIAKGNGKNKVVTEEDGIKAG